MYMRNGDMVTDEIVYSANGIAITIIYYFIGWLIIIPMFIKINTSIVVLTCIGFVVVPLWAAKYDSNRDRELNKHLYEKH